MLIHIVEDNVRKHDYIKKTLAGIFPEAEFTYTITWQKTMVKLIEAKKQPDLIIMDMMFPRRIGSGVIHDMGLTTYKDLLKRKITSPVIFFSSEDQTSVLLENGYDVPCLVYGSYNFNQELTDALVSIDLLI
ncbi:hypothetical protein DRJ25_02295 [Candidatus Woesearchaeota archaeon]|nr:MAG: hypothetical protein DRJ25_02295 [Candidatus Woesearchaeota archaeon]